MVKPVLISKLEDWCYGVEHYTLCGVIIMQVLTDPMTYTVV